MDTNKLAPVEKIKEKSRYLRGTIEEGLNNEITGSVSPDDTQLIKFHGIYQQTARELESERKKQKLEPLYSFMLRVRVPAGIITPVQWLTMDKLSSVYANNTLKLTTRQTVQFHGILKRNLKKQIRGINKVLMDSIAACGDVNRNVMCSPNPEYSDIHNEVCALAKKLSERLLPKSTAYHEIWLDNKLLKNTNHSGEENEPLYGKSYLPRKFKIAVAVPPYNDTDLFTNDIGLIAISKNSRLEGFNLVAGGGMGNTLGDDRTYPMLGEMIGFYKKKDIPGIVEEIVRIQRDYGNREDRKTARLKYTIADRGIEWFKTELEKRSHLKSGNPRPFQFTYNSDRYGWTKGTDNKWYYTLFVEHGRVKDDRKQKMKTALYEIARMHDGEFRLTGNQNIIIAGISELNKNFIQYTLSQNNVDTNNHFSPARLNSLACVALNTCPLAHAFAETYLPGLMNKIEKILAKYGLDQLPVNIRMTGCPNGCARPYNAEIGFIGRAVGIYNMYLGGNHLGTRLNKLYREMLKEEDILKELDNLFGIYARDKNDGEYFGDFTIRYGIVK